MAKTAAERKRAQRERQKASGLKRVEVHIRPEDEERLLRYVARMNKEKSNG